MKKINIRKYFSNCSKKKIIVIVGLFLLISFNIFSDVMDIDSPTVAVNKQDIELLKVTENVKRFHKWHFFSSGSIKFLVAPYFEKNKDKDVILSSLRQAGYRVYETKEKKEFTFSDADTSYTASKLLYKNTMPYSVRKWILPFSFVPVLGLFVDLGTEYRIVVAFKGDTLTDYDAFLFFKSF